MAGDSSTISVYLTGVDGAAICGDACATLPVTEQTSLASRVVTVESVTGLRVPSAALLSKADGKTVVVDQNGVEHTVTVLTSARGMSIIEGVDDGTKVRVPVAGA